MKSFKEFLNEAKLMPATKTPTSDRISGGLFVRDDITRASSYMFNKPNRKTFNIKGNNNSQLSFEVMGVFRSVHQMDITSIEEVTKDNSVYEFLRVKRDGDGAFTIETPNGDILYRVNFKDLIMSY